MDHGWPPFTARPAYLTTHVLCTLSCCFHTPEELTPEVLSAAEHGSQDAHAMNHGTRDTILRPPASPLVSHGKLLPFPHSRCSARPRMQLRDLDTAMSLQASRQVECRPNTCPTVSVPAPLSDLEARQLSEAGAPHYRTIYCCRHPRHLRDIIAPTRSAR